MPRIYYDQDADLSYLKDKTVAIVGYGNQGRSQALNLRDSGINVIVGNTRDRAWDQAKEDGFETYPVAEAVERADVIALLVPDEIAPQVYEESIVPHLKEGKVLDFASGYNVTYDFIQFPEYIDVIMVAPRMIGRSVRDLFVQGSGGPSLVGVHQDYSGQAWERALAFAKGIGSTRVGAVESSFEEETRCDLFGEQLSGGLLYMIRTAYEIMVANGISEEAAILELVASGEREETVRAMTEMGLFHQLVLHSHTSQYGQLTRGRRMVTDKTRMVMEEIMQEIVTGAFAKEWMLEQQAGLPLFKGLWKQSLRHSFTAAEKRVHDKLARKEKE
ncbi:Ketol-acid reductoisomerase [Neomoorella glycerini]|uniref:Ketol-acid reductoisomerase n=1 Tax=Neomoorella glycerini TaxID=55779 RepID=A0A6I5ZTW5_9FIRM|nr:ketol-acid reductoisomerase [Moorella glycerini]QGP93119.1 Ketol-acid reductoisomerase [Moorella glycerini]